MQAHTPAFLRLCFRDETLRRLQRFTPAGARDPCNCSLPLGMAPCVTGMIYEGREAAHEISMGQPNVGFRGGSREARSRLRHARIRTRKLTLIITSSSSTTILEVANLDDLRARGRHYRSWRILARREWSVLLFSIVVVVPEDNRNRKIATSCRLHERMPNDRNHRHDRCQHSRSAFVLDVLRKPRQPRGVSPGRDISQLWTLGSSGNFRLLGFSFSRARHLLITLISPVRSARWYKNPFYRHESLRELTGQSELKNA